MSDVVGRLYAAKKAPHVGVVARAVRSLKNAVRLMWLGSSVRGFCYRALMRFAHRFNWHYAPIIGPMMCDPGDPREGKRQRWCQWCGMRDWVIECTGPLRSQERANRSLPHAEKLQGAEAPPINESIYWSKEDTYDAPPTTTETNSNE
ncbi:hypothetical protein UFOVP868_68 [uncultured Caudovirales phage]|uniref:Uncharacterized protein n=1 Tax=uncultured Caudovirales phage TaxID=2100421 RepID=A0A6J5P9Y3_9CAUD|nr:hypothetical protein UFOVP868_68 [uncultured Caudovirales phage]